MVKISGSEKNPTMTCGDNEMKYVMCDVCVRVSFAPLACRSIRNQSTNYTQFTKLIIFTALQMNANGVDMFISSSIFDNEVKKKHRSERESEENVWIYSTFFPMFEKIEMKTSSIKMCEIPLTSLQFPFTRYRFQWFEKAENRIILLTRR